MNNPVHTVEHNYMSISSIVGIQLHSVQLHVSALYVGHRQQRDLVVSPTPTPPEYPTHVV